jgi:hypothetical protein
MRFTSGSVLGSGQKVELSERFNHGSGNGNGPACVRADVERGRSVREGGDGFRLTGTPLPVGHAASPQPGQGNPDRKRVRERGKTQVSAGCRGDHAERIEPRHVTAPGGQPGVDRRVEVLVVDDVVDVAVLVVVVPPRRDRVEGGTPNRSREASWASITKPALRCGAAPRGELRGRTQARPWPR